MHKHIRTASLLTVLTALLAGFVGLSVSPAQALGTYNATNAANWAESNWNKPPGNLDNPGNDGQCISFVGDALNQGFGTSFQWAGIQQMINQFLNPTRGTGAWEFRDISQLQVGDVVLLNQTYIAPADWLKTDAKNTIYETSLWHHIVFETQRGLFSAWNKTRHDQPLSFFMNLSAEVPDPFHYAVGIHITGYRAPTPTTKPPPPIPLHPSDIIVTINGGSIQKLGNTSYFYGAQPGSTVSGGGTIYTYVNNFGHPDNAIKYLPQFAQIGCYTAFVYVAYIRNNKYDSQSVPIQVQSNNGVANLHENFRSFNDSLGAGPTNRWLSIGNFLFAPNSGNFVLIADDTGEAAAGKVNTSTTVNFDSVKFVYLKPNCA